MIAITDEAAKKVVEILEHWNGDALRVEVKGGGCSGFMYAFSMAAPVEDSDLLIEHNGAKVAIDPISAAYLDEAILDFKKDLTGEQFVIKNPVVKTTCGCGASFST